jgi:hypothetical protein
VEPENETYRVNWPFIVLLVLMCLVGLGMWLGLAWFLMYLRSL